MPELPDLQAFSHHLSKELTGKRVEKLRAIYRKKLKTTEGELQKSIEGSTLANLYRDGKELHLAFDNGNILALHMMLRGELHVFHQSHTHKYAIVEILFSGDTGLVMTDPQRQARVILNPQPSEVPDALSPEVDYRFFKETLAASKASIKSILTDQRIIRGIGNAYADEILWEARISPFSKGNSIPQDAVKQLAKSVRTVLDRAAKTILKKYPGITAGEVRDFMAVHRKDKTHSPTGAVIRVAKTGRSTYYTDEQKLYR